MSIYWYEPNLPSIPDAPDIIKYPLDSQITENFIEVRKYKNYIPPFDFYVQLHSGLRNPTYKALFDSSLQIHQDLYDKAYLLQNLFDLSWYIGSQNELLERVGNILKYLKYNFPLFFLPYLNADVSDERNLDKENDWIRMFLESIHLQRAWKGSLLGYYLPFKLIKRKGTVFLRAQYATLGTFSEYTDKYLRLIDTNSILSLIPNVSGTLFPNSGPLQGYEDYSYVSVKYYTYDSNHFYDEEVDENHNLLNYDTGLTIGAFGKGLMLEIALDRLLYHPNSLGVPECLIDNDFLQVTSEILLNIRRATDKVMVGSQLTLFGHKEGVYTKTLSPPPPPGGYIPGTPEYETFLASEYTHPNIKAKFQIFPLNYISETGKIATISYIKIGTGDLSSIPGTSFRWVKPGDLPLPPSSYPTDLHKPLFRTPIGPYEQSNEAGHIILIPTIHPIHYLKKERYENIIIGGSAVEDINVPTTEINFPHSSLAPLSSSLLLGISLESSQPGDNLGKYAPFTFTTSSSGETIITFSSLPMGLKYPHGFAVRFTNSGGVLPTGIEAGKLYYLRRVYEDSYTQAYIYSSYEAAINLNSTEGRITLITGSGSGTHYANMYYNDYDRYILITETFNATLQLYETETTLYRKNIDGTLVPLQDRALSNYTLDSTYSTDLSYFPNKSDNIIQLLPLLNSSLQPRKKSNGEYLYSEIDHLKGSFTIRLKFDPESFLSENTTTNTYSAKGEYSYSINTLKSFSALGSFNKDTIRAITEVGIFDTNNKMIAYGTFPPIIYDTEFFHLSLNIILET